MKVRTRIFLALAATAIASLASAQQGTLDKIKASGSITVGHRDTSIPFSYIDDKQQAVGYAMDLCARCRCGQDRTQVASAQGCISASHFRYPDSAAGQRHD